MFSEWAHALSPYDFGNDNHVFFNDPSGLFSTLDEPVALPTVNISMGGTNGISSIERSFLLDQLGGGGDGFPNFTTNIFNTGGSGSGSETGDGNGDGGKKKASNNGDKLHGGSQKDRDRDIKQYPNPFQKWYHREY